LCFGSDDVDKELVDAAVVGELGMKGGGQQAPGTDEDGIVTAAGKDLDGRAEAADARRADEDHLHRAAGEGGFGIEDHRVILAAVGVALDVDVEYAEAALRGVGHVPREEDAAGAGTEDWLGSDEGIEDGVEARALEVLEEGGRLAAGKDKGVQGGEFVGLADKMRGGPELRESLGVDVEGALEGEDADLGSVFAHLLRVAAWFVVQRYSCQALARMGIVSRGRKTTDVDVVCCSGCCDFSVVCDR